MKLVETPIKSNLDMSSFYPKITSYFFGKKAIKYFKLYSLNHTQIIYADSFDKINLFLLNSKKKISKAEIDFVIKKLLASTRNEVDIHLNVKNEMKNQGFLLSQPPKDIILIQKILINFLFENSQRLRLGHKSEKIPIYALGYA